MTNEQFRVLAQASVHTARLALSLKRDDWPRVPDDEFEAIVLALGDISVTEAIAALDRWQAGDQ